MRIHEFILEFGHLRAHMFVVVAQLRDFDLLLGNRKTQQEPTIAKNTNPASENFALLIDLRSRKGPFLRLTLRTKPKAAELAGTGFSLLQGILAKIAVVMIALIRC
jgi:hypothetical protein